DHQKRWQRFVEEFGDDDDMVVVVKGKKPERMQDALEAIAAKVQEQPGYFDRLFYKVDLRPLQNRALLFLSLDQVRQIRHLLQGDDMKLLLRPPLVGMFDPWFSWRMLSLSRILDRAGKVAEKMHAGKPLSSDDQQFLQELTAISRAAATSLSDSKTYTNPWPSFISHTPEKQQMLTEPQYFFSGDRALAFLLVQPVKEKGS